MAINAPPETTPRMPPPSTTSPSFVLSPPSARPSLRKPRRRSISLTTGLSGPGCVLEVLGIFEEAILLEALVIGLRSRPSESTPGCPPRLRWRSSQSLPPSYRLELRPSAQAVSCASHTCDTALELSQKD